MAYIESLTWTFISLLLSLISIKILIPLLSKHKIIDLPGNRRSHVSATPRGAGLSLLIIYLILYPLFEYIYTSKFAYSSIIAPIIIPIGLVSFWDDLADVKISLRLLIQALCSVLAVMWLIHPHLIMSGTLPIYADLAIGSFALLSFLNVYNFMDGIDGITASESIHICVTLLLLCIAEGDIINNAGFVVPSLLIILGWNLGFLYYNWHPARIFIGDVGSITLGFLLGICILIIASSSMHLFLSCVIACLYYIADGGLTIIIRLFQGEAIWTPHLKHFFQKALKKDMSHNKVVHKIIICNITLMLLAISSLFYPISSAILAAASVSFTLLKMSRR